jgi:signal transduction protein with GAF and PtsI domain
MLQNRAPDTDIFLRSTPIVSTDVGNLFEEESFAVVSAKLKIAETFFALATRNCKFSDFCHEILSTINGTIPSEAGSLLELDQKNNSLFFRASFGQSSEDVSKFVIPVGTGIVGHVAESLQPYVEANPEGNEIHLKSISDAVGFRTRNLAAVPVLIRGKLFGVLELLNHVGEEGFSKEDVEILTYAAAQAAKCIEIRLMLSWAVQKSDGPNGQKQAA